MAPIKENKEANLNPQTSLWLQCNPTRMLQKRR